jgi:hypothetical protein
MSEVAALAMHVAMTSGDYAGGAITLLCLPLGLLVAVVTVPFVRLTQPSNKVKAKPARPRPQARPKATPSVAHDYDDY